MVYAPVPFQVPAPITNGFTVVVWLWVIAPLFVNTPVPNVSTPSGVPPAICIVTVLLLTTVFPAAATFKSSTVTALPKLMLPLPWMVKLQAVIVQVPAEAVFLNMSLPSEPVTMVRAPPNIMFPLPSCNMETVMVQAAEVLIPPVPEQAKEFMVTASKNPLNPLVTTTSPKVVPLTVMFAAPESDQLHALSIVQLALPSVRVLLPVHVDVDRLQVQVPVY